MDDVIRRYACALTAEATAKAWHDESEDWVRRLQIRAKARLLGDYDPKGPEWKLNLQVDALLGDSDFYKRAVDCLRDAEYAYQRARVRVKVYEAVLARSDPVQERRQRILEKIAELVREERCRE